MKLRSIVRILLAVAIVLAVTFPWMTAKDSASRRERRPHYDPATEMTLAGKVQAIEFAGLVRRSMGGSHLTLVTDDGTFEIRLCPRRFLAQNDFQPAQGDQVEVTGSRLCYEGRDVILAREIKLGDRTLKLRDRAGKPVWSHP